MTFRNLTSSDVVSAIEQQNIQVAAGQLGQPPVSTGQAFQFTITTLGRLTDADQFSEMILKTDAQGGVVRMRDVGRVELGAQGYDQECTLDGKQTVALSVYQLPGSNALQTAKLVKEKMEELKQRFPEGVDYAIVYDTTPFITESVNEVFKTLHDAVILVAIVVLLFLQNWRSAIIPLIAVPVAIIGTFAVMAAMGFSPQQPDALRAGAGDRHRGGRRDRGGRGGRAPHRGRSEAARGHHQGHGSGLRRRSSPWDWCSRRCSCPVRSSPASSASSSASSP